VLSLAAAIALLGALPSGASARSAYVANTVGGVSVIDTASNVVKTIRGAKEIALGNQPLAIAITPDGRFAYVANEAGGVSVIDTATNEAIEVPDGSKLIKVGLGSAGIAIAPDQPPAASLQLDANRLRPGVAQSFDASASRDPDSASYAWNFGDGQSQSLASPRAIHTFAKPGTYTVSLKETDAEGCSTPETFLSTGQTPYCTGNAGALLTKTITVAYPGVSLKCPPSAKPRGCVFKLRAIVAKPKRGKAPRPASALARAKAMAGRSTIVSILPKPAFNARLARAQSILVKETVLAKGKARTRFVKLAVVR
jgi:hypothetical protein